VTAPDRDTISFLDIKFFITGPRVDPEKKPDFTLYECGECAALVREEKIQDHAQWHGKVRKEVTMAAMGLGGLGL
jgi:hypothetical protein